jgi:uncharacterized protein
LALDGQNRGREKLELSYIISIVGITFVASVITLLTGFGLGTILTPVFIFFYDVKVAVMLVAIVHFLNNLLRLILFRNDVDLNIVKKFGALSIVGAFAGAYLQQYLFSDILTALLGILLIFLGAVEFLPNKGEYKLPPQIDFLGSIASGFLGGLLGNQGALRSLYLLNYDLKKEQLVATAALIAVFIDATRLPIYLISYRDSIARNWVVLLVVVSVAYIGTLVGKKLLEKVSITQFKRTIAGFVILLGVGLVGKYLYMLMHT